MVEHREWVGSEYDLGIEGQRIAIMGFSHHGNPDGEGSDFTERTLEKVCAGRSHAFFDQVQGYFGVPGREAFWNSVVFFNYLPDLVGSSDDRFGYGSPEQHERASERFMRILGRRCPDKVLVFSMKAWGSMGALRAADQKGKPLGAEGEFPRRFGWRTYEVDGHVTAAFGLRHTQGAPKEMMVQAVRRVMSLDVPGSPTKAHG